MCFWATSVDAGLISLRIKTKQFLETLHCTTLISHHLGLWNSHRLENKMSLRANTFFAHDFFNQLILSEMSNLNSPKADSQKTDAMVSHSDKLFLI